MKRFFISGILAVFMCMMGCLAPNSSSSSETVTAALSATNSADIAVENSEHTQTVTVDKKIENKDPQPATVLQLPMTPANLANNLYFGIRILTENEGEDDESANRRLTLKFNEQGTKAGFGDTDTEAESKKANTKQNLDVKIEGMFVTLLDNGREFLKLEVSKDFQFMFINEDKIESKPVQGVNYKNTGLALNGYEWHGKASGYNGPILPQLPKYPFES